MKIGFHIPAPPQADKFTGMTVRKEPGVSFHAGLWNSRLCIGVFLCHRIFVPSVRQIKYSTTFIHSYPIGICETQIRQIAYMLFCPARTKIQTSGKFKSKSIKERKNEKVNDVYNGSRIDRPRRGRDGLSFNNSSVSDNVSAITSPDIVLGIQSDDGSVCIVHLEVTDAGRPGPAVASAGANIIQQLPDATTLVLLGFGGLLYRRRKQ